MARQQVKKQLGTGYLMSSCILVILLSFLRVLNTKLISKAVYYSIVIFYLYVQYENPKIKKWYYYRPNDTTSLASEVLITFFLPSLSFTSTIACLSCWGILIYLFLLYQIGMDQPAYDQPGICHLGTTHMCDSFVRDCVLYFSYLSSSLTWYPFPHSMFNNRVVVLH